MSACSNIQDFTKLHIYLGYASLCSIVCLKLCLVPEMHLAPFRTMQLGDRDFTTINQDQKTR